MLQWVCEQIRRFYSVKPFQVDAHSRQSELLFSRVELGVKEKGVSDRPESNLEQLNISCWVLFLFQRYQCQIEITTGSERKCSRLSKSQLHTTYRGYTLMW